MNCKNRSIGKSGYRGVCVTSQGTYYASIQFTMNNDGVKEVHRIRGIYRSNAEDAYIDYLKLALQYHKEYSSVYEDFYNYGLITEDEFLNMINS